MSYFIDKLARNIGARVTRRTAIDRFGYSLLGGVTSIFGPSVAVAAPTCGACKACDTKTKKCNLPCKPSAAGKTICSNAFQDGTFLRITNFLTKNGFSLNGTAVPTQFYNNDKLDLSTVTTNYKSSSSPKITANAIYALTAKGDVYSAGVVLQDGKPLYAISVDPSGRILRQFATAKASSSQAAGVASDQYTESAQTYYGTSANILAGPVTPAVGPETCGGIVDVFCTLVTSIGCIPAVARACVLAGLEYPACVVVMTGLCGLGSLALCTGAKKVTCECGLGQRKCGDLCCDKCHDCLNDRCVPMTKCGTNACCDGFCCEPGYTCQGGVCTSPNSKCVGATCTTFVPCSTNRDCVCVTLASGGGLCFPGSTPCAGLAKCNDAPCPTGYLCAIGTCCVDSVCVPISGQCPPEAAASTQRTIVPGAGPTIGQPGL